MTAHDRFLELAAAAIDFDLPRHEREELDRHLAGCADCRRDAARFHEDAAALRAAPRPALHPDRSRVILTTALARRRPASPLRLLAVAALFALVVGGALAIGSRLLEVDEPDPSVRPTPGLASPVPGSPAPSAPASTPGPTGSSGPVASPSVSPSGGAPLAPGRLPVTADARSEGAGVRLAAADGGVLFVTIPTAGSTILTRLGPDGAPSAGWPVTIPAQGCQEAIPGADGSVRLICRGPEVEELFEGPQRAFALDVEGRLLSGWPADIPCCSKGTMVGDRLVLVASRYTTDVVDDPGAVVGVNQVAVVEADGTVGVGAETPLYGDQIDSWIGPDGIGYALRLIVADDTAEQTEVSAFDAEGVLEGWPVRLGGLVSPPAFLPGGRVAFTVAVPGSGRSRIVTLDRGGEQIAESDELPTVPGSEWSGAGPDVLGTLVVAPDGTMWVVGQTAESSDHRIWSLDPSGRIRPGWPVTTPTRLAEAGHCPVGDTGCGLQRSVPTIGQGNVLHVVLEPGGDAGGAATAYTAAGEVVEGWPVTLNRAGSMFWMVDTGPDGISYALAIEPETGDRFSGTVLALDPDSTVRYSTTIIEP